ncbi:MAG: 2,3-bisphosphoglycerate-independent phosphoglycerate mutase [Chloroflexi bacterium]|nr:2,3-bisphosphoglycerate-independent phosphoglycerate mutase [Chloroflexota bacterium]
MDIEVIQELAQPSTLPNGGKIVLAVMDGLGGLPIEPGGPTELEAANTPNLDQLAREGTTGLSIPIARGISPGSGPGHLGLFGYDPLRYEIGRGVLEALGIDFDLQPDDLAARGNFCTVDEEGRIVDRRAGRIPTEIGARLCEKLQKETSIPGYEIFVRPVKEYRFVLVVRGPGLADGLSETDPQRTGVPPLPIKPLRDDPATVRTAKLLNDWLEQARRVLANEHPANSLNLRGLAKDPGIPSFQDIYKLNAAAIATYPMYRGVARLCGMQVLSTGETMASELDTLEQHWDEFDFFFIHFKYTDSRGEDGDFQAKVKVIEEVDGYMSRIRALNPSVLIVTGDHSTPALLRSHSWHPVPLLMWGPTVRPDEATSFGERACARGGLGHFLAKEIMPMAMGHAGRLAKFGA